MQRIIFFKDSKITWWKNPPEYPDLNPIENLWHELKGYLRREVKPHSKEELKQGAMEIWETDTGERYRKYIRHLKRLSQQ